MATQRPDIFDAFDREDPSPASHSESTFEFMNRASGEFWEYPRKLMQDWADRVVEPQDYEDLRKRFRCRDDGQFRSAFLELYVHECLLRGGYEVQIHPRLHGTARRPDFLATRAGQSIYVEAIAPGSTPAAKAAAGRRAVLFDTVDQVGDPNFFLMLEELQEGLRPAASARLRDDLRRWLASMDPDEHADLDTAPQYRWEKDGWSVTFRAIAKGPGRRGRRKGERSIGVFAQGEASFIDDAPKIKAALGAKDHAYGEIEAPFVVAVGTYIFDTDRWHATNALYGQDSVQIVRNASGAEQVRSVRQPTGYFGVPPAWANRHVSGVLLVNQLMPYYPHKAEATLWLHPLPLHAVPPTNELPWTRVTWDGRALVSSGTARTASDFFGLREPWPPGERFPEA